MYAVCMQTGRQSTTKLARGQQPTYRTLVVPGQTHYSHVQTCVSLNGSILSVSSVAVSSLQSASTAESKAPSPVFTDIL